MQEIKHNGIRIPVGSKYVSESGRIYQLYDEFEDGHYYVELWIPLKSLDEDKVNVTISKT